MKNKQEKNKLGVVFWFMIYLGIFGLGIVGGMILQQAIFKQGLIDVLSYSNLEVNVNLNETKMISEMSNTFIPLFNQTFIREFPKCCYPLDCPQSKNNPKECNCLYAIKCEFDLKP